MQRTLLFGLLLEISPEMEKKLNAKFVTFDELIAECDVVTINCPLHAKYPRTI